MARKKNSVRTSKKLATLSSQILKNKQTSKSTKKLAASTLSNRKKTSKK